MVFFVSRYRMRISFYIEFFFLFELGFQATSVKAMCGFESEYVAGNAANISSRMECFHVDMHIY